ncbi:glutamyl-tRNA reductase [Myxococcota bacterium]|nr:glutamyl-tRNA reductase [Myxococcota bacterium]
MKLVVTGLSHRTAPIELRERFAQNTQKLEKTFADLKRSGVITEIAVISTCNRVEFYAAGADPVTLGRAIRGFAQSFSGMPPAALEEHLYQHEGTFALKHLFRVASSLDSMVLGEPQILGQVKEAYHKAVEHHGVGPVLTRVFHKAFAVAKKVRTDTGIAENAVSMSFAAVELGRQIFKSLEGKQVLVVGAGKMSTLAAKHLQAYGVAQIRVANRSIAAAQALADEIGGLASSLSDLPMLLAQADIVISSTAAPGFVIDKPLMTKVVRDRRYKPILLVDIAVPRDIDPTVADLDNVFVYDVDDLEHVLETNRDARAKEAEAAERIVEDEVAAYSRWAKSQQVVPVIKALRAYATKIAESEAERTLSHLKGADKKAEQSVRAMAQAIVNKMLHPVQSTLKQEGADGDPQAHVDALAALFGLDVAAFEEPLPHAEHSEESAPAQTNVVQLRQAD